MALALWAAPACDLPGAADAREPGRPHAPAASGAAVLDALRGATAAPAAGAPLAPRLSIDPDAPDARGAPPADLLALAARASAAAAAGDPAGAHAAALLDLRWGDTARARLDAAIDALEGVAASTARAAPALADLAAARLLRAERGGDGRALVGAIDAAARAVRLAPADRAARFNLTLALERAGLVDGAATSAAAYLTLDATGAWAPGARGLARRAAAAPSPVPPAPSADAAAVAAFVRHDHQRARQHGWDVALAAWAAETAAGRPSAAGEWLALATRLGAALADAGGDASLHEAAAAIARAPVPVATARAVLAYAAADREYRAGNYAVARRQLAGALAAPHAPAALRRWARFLHAACLSREGAAARAEAELRALLATLDRRRHPALAGRAHATLGTTYLRAGRDAEAGAAVTTAERLLDAAGETEHLGAVLALRSDAAFARGDADAAYAAGWRALDRLRTARASVWRHNVLYVLAREAEREGLSDAAARLADEDVETARRSGRGLTAAEALLLRARLRAAAGDRAGHAADVADAAAFVRVAPPGRARDWLAADLALSRARARLDDAPAAAAGLADSAVRYFEGTGNVVRLLPALALRAEASAGGGDAAAALRDLAASVTLLAARADRLGDASARARLVLAAGRTVTRLVLLELARGDPVAALAQLDGARALLGPSGGGAPSSRPASPPGETAVVWARAADTLLVWVVRDDRVHLARRTIDGAALDRLIARTRVALERRASDAVARPLLAALHAQLVGPVAARLGGAERPLVLVPDGSLAGVPFPALLDARRGRYLVEDHPLRVEASLAAAAAPAPAVARGARAPLLVGDPAFDARRHPGLGRLPGAAAETRALAASYGGARVLLGASATPAAVLDALPTAAILHYSGHAVYDAARPERSALVLAAPAAPAAARESAAGGPSNLEAGALSRLRLPRLRLVVLAACQTFGARPEAIGGASGMADAFRAAGAAGVLGAALRVDDAATRPLMLAFHEAYAAGHDGPAALRTAQRRMLAAEHPAHRSPAAWAAFQFHGR